MALPTLVHAVAVPDPRRLHDTVSINIQFDNGSIGTVCYFSNGSRMLSKEYVEVYQNGQTAILDDFRQLTVYGHGRPFTRKLLNQDKGQTRMVRAFLDRINTGGPPLIPLEQLARVTQITFAVHESIRTRQAFGV